jgi:hypothetical protein
MLKKFLSAQLLLQPPIVSSNLCSGLIEMDTLIKDNVVNYWSPHESKTSIQELPKRV